MIINLSLKASSSSSAAVDVLATVSGESKAAIERLSGSIGEMRTEELKRMMTAISTLDSKVQYREKESARLHWPDVRQDLRHQGSRFRFGLVCNSADC